MSSRLYVAWHLLLRAPAIALAACVVVLARALRPLVTVRFAMLDAGRIGMLAVAPEIYLCEREARLHGHRTLDLFYAEGLVLPPAVPGGPSREQPVCNEVLLRMWRRVIPIHPFVLDLVRVSRRLPGHARHVLRLHDWDGHGLLATTGPHLRFTSSETQQVEEGLRGLGLSPGDRFVTFHARDSAYLTAAYPGASWAYHAYRDADVATYLPAIQELVRRGLRGVRVGSMVGRPLLADDPMIIDYPSTGRRSELLDIALGARCRFFLGNDSGLLFVPVIFRRRVALANYTILGLAPIWSKDDLFITKRVWWRDERRLLTFREMMDLPQRNEGYEARGLEVINNTSEEILDLAVEMEERLSGTWRSADEDDDLQARFRAIVTQGPSIGPNLARIGAKFLRENRRLLDD